jgi:hypothetical protein
MLYGVGVHATGCADFNFCVNSTPLSAVSVRDPTDREALGFESESSWRETNVERDAQQHRSRYATGYASKFTMGASWFWSAFVATRRPPPDVRR